MPNKVKDEITFQFPNFSRGSLEMGKQFYPTLYKGYNLLSTLGFKLKHVSKRGTGNYRAITGIRTVLGIFIKCTYYLQDFPSFFTDTNINSDTLITIASNWYTKLLMVRYVGGDVCWISSHYYFCIDKKCHGVAGHHFGWKCKDFN